MRYAVVILTEGVIKKTMGDRVTALRKCSLLCGLLSVLLLVGAVAASILLPFPEHSREFFGN